MVRCLPLARSGGTAGRPGSGCAVSLGHARPFSACLSKLPARCAGPLTAHHMFTIGRQKATGPSPATTDYACPSDITRQNRRVAGHICLSVLARLRRRFPRTLIVIPGDCAHRAVYRDPREPEGGDGEASRLDQRQHRGSTRRGPVADFPRAPVFHSRCPRFRQALPGPVPADRARQPRGGRDRGPGAARGGGPERRDQRLLPDLPRSRRGRRAPLGRAGQLARRHRRPGLAAEEPGLGHEGRRGRPGRARWP